MNYPKDFINKIICGNNKSIIPLILDNSIDLIMTDPPYRITTGGGMIGEKRDYFNKLKQTNSITFTPKFYLNLLKPKCKKFYGYFFCNKFLIKEYLDFAIINNYVYDILILAKTNPIPAYYGHHLSDLEYIILIREKGTYFSKHKNLDDFRKFYLTSCKKGLHPAEKPLELIKRYLKVSSKENDIILDPFIGSGTTAVACKKLNRNYIGIEISPEYCKIAKERLKEIK